MEYSELEKKVIDKGIKDFRKELQEASKPMIEVLKKFGLHYDSKLLKEITLRYPYGNESYDKHTVSIPNDEGLKDLHPKILSNFLTEIKEIKERVEHLEY